MILFLCRLLRLLGILRSFQGVFKAFTLKGAFVFCSAVTLLVGSLRWGRVVIGEECFVV